MWPAKHALNGDGLLLRYIVSLMGADRSRDSSRKKDMVHVSHNIDGIAPLDRTRV
jgi:hypothetical protein